MAGKTSRVHENAINLDSISALGGEKADLDLLNDIDDEAEELDDFDDDTDADPVKRDDVKDFIKKLGIKQYRDTNSKKEKKVKLLEIKQDEEATTETGSKKKNKGKIQHDEVSSTTKITFDIRAHIRNYQSRQYLVIKTGQNWLDVQVPEDTNTGHSREIEQQMENFASKLLQDEVAVYNKQRESSKKSDIGWIKTVLSSGTLGDKIAALTLLVQESPIQNLSSLENLIGMAKKKGRRECIMAAETLKELFVTYLLPNDRKLKTFDQHPLSMIGELSGGNKDVVDRYILVWYYESKLKEQYAHFIEAVKTMSHDTLLNTKQKALGIIYDLLVAKPEQEKTLLNLLVNKVGDPDYKLASKTAYQLNKLVETHPNMKRVVVDEVERLLYRPNISLKAQYYSICFLNHLVLSKEDKLLAAKLITVYFSFFKSFVKKGEVDSKMMSALLTGVNRSYPYAKVDADYLSEQLNTIYKLVHVVNFNTSLQALMLLYQVMDSSETVSDRYYVALYKKMSDPNLKSSSKQSMFLNLLFKSMRKDTVDRRVKAFIKRLLQVCTCQPPQFVCGALVLLGELVKLKPAIIVDKHVPEESDDDEDEHFTDLPDPDDEEEKMTKTHGDEVKSKSSWVHKSNVKTGTVGGHYDPHHRNPLFCNADNECIWELKQLVCHFHPTVSLFANRLVKGEPVTYTGNPLEDFTTIRFLDRFVYKNPKKKDSLPELSMGSKQKSQHPKGIKSIPVNSEKYLENPEDKIPVEELFYYRYFTQKAARKKKDDTDDMSETESVSDGEFDQFLDKYEKTLEPGSLGEDDYDFASEVKKKTKKGSEAMDEDEDEDEEFSDEEVDFEGDEDFANAFKEYDEDMLDEENVEFSDEDELLGPSKEKKKKKEKKSSKKTKKDNDDSLFAAAEEFSHIIDDNTDLKSSMIGSDAVSNKDNAHMKQLKWEADRDRWIHHGHRNKRQKKQKKMFKKRKN